MTDEEVQEYHAIEIALKVLWEHSIQRRERPTKTHIGWQGISFLVEFIKTMCIADIETLCLLLASPDNEEKDELRIARVRAMALYGVLGGDAEVFEECIDMVKYHIENRIISTNTVPDGEHARMSEEQAAKLVQTIRSGLERKSKKTSYLECTHGIVEKRRKDGKKNVWSEILAEVRVEFPNAPDSLKRRYQDYKKKLERKKK